MKFKAICSKENQKLTISLEAVDAANAREILHNQGYSIIELQAWDEAEAEGNFFYFDIRVDGIIKSWQIQSNDIFKAYKKLVQDLGHDVVYIYTSKNTPEDQKKIITAKVKNGYDLYIQNTKTKEQQADEDEDERNDINGDVYNQISVETKREIEKYNKVIDTIIEKIQNLTIKYNQSISEERKLKFEELQQALYQSKSSTNTGKLKLISETALLKIGEVELDLAKLEVGEERKKFFETTNKLLKEVGSKSKFEIKEKKELPEFVTKIQTYLKKITKEANTAIENNTPPAPKQVDKTSFAFYKNLRELKIYKSLLHKTEMLIFNSLIRLNLDEAKRLFLKRKLLYQNIQIIENRINNKNFSYTKIIRGADYYIHAVLKSIAYIGDIFLYSLLAYSLAFITSITLNKLGFYIDLQNNLLFFIVIIAWFVITTRFYLHLYSFLIAFSSLLFFILFLSINF
jgi:hypothetical protein